MALTFSQFSVSTVAALIGILPGGASVRLQPGGTVTVFTGNSTAVTISNGYPLVTTEPTVFTLPVTSAPSTLYAIAATSTSLGAAFITAS
jgi:hypothetical protein